MILKKAKDALRVGDELFPNQVKQDNTPLSYSDLYLFKGMPVFIVSNIDGISYEGWNIYNPNNTYIRIKTKNGVEQNILLRDSDYGEPRWVAYSIRQKHTQAVINTLNKIGVNWTLVDKKNHRNIYECNHCLHKSPVRTRYCPNCGSKMIIPQYLYSDKED